MAGSGDEEGNAVLSDVEGDDPMPILFQSSSADEISQERFREIVAELDREKQARLAAEKSRADLEVSFNRLKALTHEAIRKRDEVGRQRNEAIREKEEVLANFEKVKAELSEANREKVEVAKKASETTRQFDEVVKERDGLRSEIGNSMHMLVTGTEKISGKVSAFKNFGNTGLPRSSKYSGMAAVAYGVIKRTNEIVEELLKQIESASKSRNEAREQIGQRNYEIAIEVSQLEAAISGLRAEVLEKASAVEELEKRVAEREGKVSEIERETAEKLAELEIEAAELRRLVSKYEDKLAKLESKTEAQRPLLFDQLNLVSKIHDRVCYIIKIVDASTADQSEFSESLFVPQETDVEENVRASLAGMESIFEITRVVAEKTRYLIEEKNREIRSLDDTISRLNKEKEHIGSLLRSALSKRVTSNRSSKTSDLFHVAENGLREAGIDFKFGKLTGDRNSSDKVSTMESEDEEIYALAGALEEIIKTSQLEIIELQHSVAELRAESCLLKAQVETQTKELDQCLRQIEQLKEKEKVANDSVEGLMMDIAAAEEEITRWKLAAEQEATAGRAVEQEFVAQLSALKQEVEEAKGAMAESDKKLKFKEETAAAAMGARDAAEKSLRMADSRASRLRERVEELTRQLEELESREDSRRGGWNGGPRYMCWPWQWLGMDFVGVNLRPDTQEQQGSNEMELSEPFL